LLAFKMQNAKFPVLNRNVPVRNRKISALKCFGTHWELL